MNNQNNQILLTKIKYLLSKYNLFIKNSSKNKYTFRYNSCKFVCSFTTNNIEIHIFSLKNIHNNIEFNINFTRKEGEIININKNQSNKFNTNYQPKSLIKTIIKICKILKLEYIKLTDNSFFLCHGYKINLNNYTMLKDRVSWYQKYFNFILIHENNKLEFENSLEILSSLTIQNILDKIPEFNYILEIEIKKNNKNQTNKINHNILLSTYLQKHGHFNKKQCKYLSEQKIFDKIISQFHLINLYGKEYILFL